MEHTVAKGSDPVYQDFRIAFGVEDKDKYVDHAKATKEANRERRSSKCLVCPPGDRNKAIFKPCVSKPDIECNCCKDHRKNCVLK